MKTQFKVLSILGLSVALAAGAAALSADDKPAAIKVGDKASTFTLKDLNGKEHKPLEDNKGKIIVLEWVNPKCPVCKGAHEDGRIPNMINAIKDMDDVVHYGINSTHNTTAEAEKAALKAYGIEYTVLLDVDGSVGHMFGAKTTPHLFVIDTEGVLRYQGALDDDKSANKTRNGEDVTNYALNAIEQIKAGETVSPDSTQPYGCGVKYARTGKDKSDS